MSEYSLEFSQKLIEADELLGPVVEEDLEGKRATLYLSLLSAEITLKAALEKAGKPVREIRKHSHNLASLLAELGDCEVEVNITSTDRRMVSAARIRSVPVDQQFSNATVGTLLSGEKQGASVYPNQIRYGESLTHYPPGVMLQAAKEAKAWVIEHFDSIRCK